MKHRLFALPLALALFAPLAQADQPTAAQTTASPYRTVLWKVSDTDNSVYLLGSFHLLKADDYPLPKIIDAAFEDAESLMFELPPGAMTSPETATVMQKYAAYENGDSLSKVLPKATYDKLSAMVTASGASIQSVEQTEPWAISLGMVVGMSQAMGFRPELGLDQHLMERATKVNKPAVGLETAEDQMKALDSIPYAEQAHGLNEFLADPMKTGKDMLEMHAAWRAGDIEKLDGEMRVKMQTETPESYRVLNLNRNANWLPQVEARLIESHSDDTLVVVGALHLLGEDGLVERLKAKGYKVERLGE